MMAAALRKRFTQRFPLKLVGGQVETRLVDGIRLYDGAIHMRSMGIAPIQLYEWEPARPTRKRGSIKIGAATFQHDYLRSPLSTVGLGHHIWTTRKISGRTKDILLSMLE